MEPTFRDGDRTERRTKPCKPVLACFAVKQEAQYVAHPQIDVLLTGIGRANAERNLRAALQRTDPLVVLSCGFAGGLNPLLKAGHVVFSPKEEAGLTMKLIAAGASPAWFHCVPRVVTTAAEKKMLRETIGADAVEMESEYIRAICQAKEIPGATIRVISDAADENLPLDFSAFMTGEQELDYRKLTLALLRAPWKLPAVLRLRRHTRLAAKNLAQVLHAIIPS